MVETPKLDELAKLNLKWGDRLPRNWEVLLYDALLEVREILKTVRQKSLP